MTDQVRVTVGQWRSLVRQVPSIWDQLEITKRKQTSARARGGAGRADHLWVMRYEAADLMWQIEALLRTICTVYFRESSQPIRFLQVAEMVARLDEHASWVVNHSEGESWSASLARLIDAAWAEIDNPPDLIRIGECGALRADGSVCASDLWHEAGQEVVQCKVCGAVVQVRERRDQALARAADFKAPLSTVVQALQKSGVRVTMAQARSWTQRRGKKDRRLNHVDVNHDGVRLYTVGDVMKAASR